MQGRCSYGTTCYARASRRATWARASDAEQIDMAAAIGVERGFCHHGRPPQFDDDGLHERLAVRPLPGGGIYLCGPVGSHKTHLAAARTIDAARRGFTARMVGFRRFCLEVRATYAPTAIETELDILTRYAALDYLAIDDLGAGAPKQAAIDLCYDLLNDRYAAGRITDATSNLTKAELGETFDARIARRAEHLCATYVMLAE